MSGITAHAPALPGVSDDTLHELLARAGELAANARSANTRRAYRSRLQQWFDWSGLGPHDPITAEMLVAYIGWMERRGLAVPTIDLTLAALRDLHSVQHPGSPSPLDHPLVRLVRAGVRRTVGVAPKRQAHPLTTEQVSAMLVATDHTNPIGVRDRAMILLWFAAGLRRSELAALDYQDVRRKGDGLVVTLTGSKGDQERSGQTVGVVRGEHAMTCPVRAWAVWSDLRGPVDGPAFWRGHGSGQLLVGARYTAASAARRLQQIAAAAGLGDLPISGHSPRAGHATTAAINGAPLERIAATTRHARLDTTRRYTRDADALRQSTSVFLGL